MIMKKTKMLLALGIIMGVMGCNDEVVSDMSTPTESTKGKEAVITFLKKNAPQEQKFTVDSDQPIFIKTKGNLEFQFPLNAFRTKAGKVVSGM